MLLWRELCGLGEIEQRTGDVVEDAEHGVDLDMDCCCAFRHLARDGDRSRSLLAAVIAQWGQLVLPTSSAVELAPPLALRGIEVGEGTSYCCPVIRVGCDVVLDDPRRRPGGRSGGEAAKSVSIRLSIMALESSLPGDGLAITCANSAILSAVDDKKFSEASAPHKTPPKAYRWNTQYKGLT